MTDWPRLGQLLWVAAIFAAALLAGGCMATPWWAEDLGNLDVLVHIREPSAFLAEYNQRIDAHRAAGGRHERKGDLTGFALLNPDGTPAGKPCEVWVRSDRLFHGTFGHEAAHCARGWWHR
ncbi:MAG: hypothetical protein ABII82_18900 [Verrucomicrobiota bacterium]